MEFMLFEKYNVILNLYNTGLFVILWTTPRSQKRGGKGKIIKCATRKQSNISTLSNRRFIIDHVEMKSFESSLSKEIFE